MVTDDLAEYYAQQVSNPRLQRGQEVFAQASLAALERLTPLPRLREVLDVGAGYGFLLASLRNRHGIAGTGVEPSAVESEYGRVRLGVDIRTSLLSGSGLTPGSYDLVCAFEVLEHTVDPAAFVNELASYVAPGGYLVIGTDNFDSDVVRRLGHGFPKWIPHTHVSHFTPATIRTLCGQIDGFAVDGYASYTPWEFLARRAVSSFRASPTVEAAYEYETALTQEVSRSFRLYRLRRAITPMWFAISSSKDLSGEMMFISLQRHR
jgi:SAM-dependent methyltransferase